MKITSEQILLSSPLGYLDQASQDLYKNDFFVHTLESDYPFIVFDLEKPVLADAILITNRNLNPEIQSRAIGLKLAISENFVDWMDTNLSAGEDLSYFLAIPSQKFRFIRVSLEDGKNRVINLKSIELFGVRESSNSKKVKFNSHKLISGIVVNRVYYHTYDWGFFSNLTTTLQDIANHFPNIDRIDSSYSFSRYKDTQGQNTWLEYFSAPNKKINSAILDDNFYGKDTYQHAPYTGLDFFVGKQLINSFFVPSAQILERYTEIKEKNNIDFENTAFIYFRGTDKRTELDGADVQDYLDQLNPILESNPNLKVVLQTDDLEFGQAFQSQFTGSLTVLNELPLIAGIDGFHNVVSENKFITSIDFFAIVLLMSQCKYLVLNTSNVSFWATLYRGHADGVIQIDEPKVQETV
jgi:hypothetical protein